MQEPNNVIRRILNIWISFNSYSRPYVFLIFLPIICASRDLRQGTNDLIKANRSRPRPFVRLPCFSFQPQAPHRLSIPFPTNFYGHGSSIADSYWLLLLGQLQHRARVAASSASLFLDFVFRFGCHLWRAARTRLVVMLSDSFTCKSSAWARAERSAFDIRYVHG